MSSPLSAEVVDQVVKHLTGDKSLQASNDVLLRQALCLATGHVVDSSLVVAKATHGDEVQSSVGLTIPIYGKTAMVAALGRAIAFSRYRAADVRSIIMAGVGAHEPVTPGAPIPMEVPPVPLRPLSAYAMGESR